MRRSLLTTIILVLLLACAGLSVELTPCSPCGGSGHCHVCGGDGQRSDGTTCAICSGSGDCYYCGGRGKY